MTNPIETIHAMIAAAIEAADPAKLVADNLRATALGGERIFLISVGKAAVAMATAAHETLGERIVTGAVISKLGDDHAAVTALPDHLPHFQAGHPIPDARSTAATNYVRQLLEKTTADDLVLCCISGGASALLTAPVLTLPQWRELNTALIGCGCSINEVNHIRQQFDAVKGGGLARWAVPAHCHTLILSDVIGNNVAHIGSGPTVITPRNLDLVQSIMNGFDVWSRLSDATCAAIKQHLVQVETRNFEEETQDVEDETQNVASLRVRPINKIIGDVTQSAAAAAQTARAHGYEVHVVSTELTGEAKEVGRQLGERSLALRPGECLIYGGETTVTLGDNAGVGGRNQELALAAAIALDGQRDLYVATLATDGEDGANDAAGAIVSGESVRQAQELGLSAARYLAHHDSYTFFEKIGRGHLRIGATGTNVNDIVICLRG